MENEFDTDRRATINHAERDCSVLDKVLRDKYVGHGQDESIAKAIYDAY